MTAECSDVQEFLQRLFTLSGFDMSVEAKEQEGCYVSITGADAQILLISGGELLEVVEYFSNKAFARKLAPGMRVTCDVNGYRAAREAELRVMAYHAAEQVQQHGQAFTFAPMNANERRLIHKALSENPNVVTGSVDEGTERRLKVSPRKESH